MRQVDVIVPVYNVEKYLKRCLESLINQTLSSEKYRVLLVDDGSTDGSPTICQKYADENPPAPGKMRPRKRKQKKSLTNGKPWHIIATNKKPVIEKSNRSIFVYSEPQMVKVRQRKDRRMAS